MIPFIISLFTTIIAWLVIARQGERLTEAEQEAAALRKIVKDYEARYGNVPIAPLEVLEILDIPRDWIPEYIEVEK